ALAQFDHAYQAAVRDVERARELMKVRAITTADSEQAELTYQRAELAQRQARRNYELTRIAAPFGGVVTARTVRPGRLVTLGDSLFRVSALGPLRVSVRVPEGPSAGLTPGARGEGGGRGGGVARAEGVRASPAIDAASGTREVLVELAPGAPLRPGAGAPGGGGA